MLAQLQADATAVIILKTENQHAMPELRKAFFRLMNNNISNPVIINRQYSDMPAEQVQLYASTDVGGLLLDGLGDGVCFGMTAKSYERSIIDGQQSSVNASVRTYLQNGTVESFINNIAFSVLQATRTRISKTEYISCPSCGRTLFDLQETTAKIRSVTSHLKGVKIAIMGCIVNGPGEMADADFGYVGSGPGKITLYKGKEVVKRNVASEVAVEELVSLLKENGAWVESK
jgi:(E)-4-hydroxy-3-methylbut-2-enyl-diphosphate synthase